jgi:hypothetical protein
MPNTQRMKWPYPAENTEPHFDALVSFFTQQDASGYAAREDRHIICQKGGPITFNATTGVLSWGSDIEILAAITGFNWRILTGQVTVDDAELVYVDLVRAPTQNRTVAPIVAGQVPSTDTALIIGIRRGNKFYFRSGALLGSGETLDDIAPGGAGDNFSYKTVAPGVTITVPEHQQMIVHGGMNVYGTVNLIGEIVLL